jgi:hypothetical protein
VYIKEQKPLGDAVEMVLGSDSLDLSPTLPSDKGRVSEGFSGNSTFTQ